LFSRQRVLRSSRELHYNMRARTASRGAPQFVAAPEDRFGSGPGFQGGLAPLLLALTRSRSEKRSDKWSRPCAPEPANFRSSCFPRQRALRSSREFNSLRFNLPIDRPSIVAAGQLHSLKGIPRKGPQSLQWYPEMSRIRKQATAFPNL